MVSKAAGVVRMHLSVGAFAGFNIGLYRIIPSTLIQLENNVAATGIVVNVKAERISTGTLAVKDLIPRIVGMIVNIITAISINAKMRLPM